MMLINNIITVGASLFIAYYKVLEINKERIENNKKHIHTHNNYTYDIIINNESYNDMPLLD